MTRSHKVILFGAGVDEQHIGVAVLAQFERLASAHRLLVGLDYKSDIEYPLIWLPLPEPWRAGQFAAALRQAGVLVRTADHFAVGRSSAPHAIRISLNSAASVAQLEEGLVILRALLDSPPSMAMDP